MPICTFRERPLSRGPVTRDRISLSLSFQSIEAMDRCVKDGICTSRSDAASRLILEGWSALRRGESDEAERKYREARG